ncbi:MAG: hypothetical protein WEB87_05745 [Bacteriovoracaceae bacterium]
MSPNFNLLKLCGLAASFIYLLTSCANQPIRRGGSGYSARGQYGYQQNRPEFHPIRKKVALLPFYNESPFGKEDLAITATEEFRKELGRMRDFVIDPEAQSLFGSSKEIYAGGGMKLSQLSRKAKLSGVNLVVYGRITHARVRQKTDEIGMVRKTKSYAESVVELRVYDIHANKEIFSEKMDGNINDSAHKFFLSERDATINYRRNLLRYSVRVAVRRFLPKIDKLGAKLDWTGRVAKIIGSKIYVNAGRKSGITVGDILKVMTEGSEVFDPESGALIGISQGEVKGTLEVIDFFGPDGAVAILHSGGSVTEGDFVQLY